MSEDPSSRRLGPADPSPSSSASSRPASSPTASSDRASGALSSNGISRATTSEAVAPLRIGLPLWGFRAWQGSLYRDGAGPSDYLRQYASAFDAVEGNTTFYSVPSADVVARWRDDTPPSFRFCFKLPRAITHDALLKEVRAQTETFLQRMSPLGERLGPFMLQLPAAFGPLHLDALDAFLGWLPKQHRYAVELRNPLFFAGGPDTKRARALVATHDCDWIHLDTRGLRAGPEDHPDVTSARHPKPHLPVEPFLTGPHPIVRFVGHPQLEHNEAALARWCDPLTDWIARGARPYFFAHCPNDLHAPGIARRAHAVFAARLPLPAPRPWPGETGPRQLSLL